MGRRRPPSFEGPIELDAIMFPCSKPNGFEQGAEPVFKTGLVWVF